MARIIAESSVEHVGRWRSKYIRLEMTDLWLAL